MFQKIPLKDIVYHPTFNCNLTCRGCINYSDHLETRSIPDEPNWKRDFNILFERFDVDHIEVAGGETLMFKDIEPLFNYLHQSNTKKYTLITNGLLLHKNKWVKDLLDLDNRFKLVITCQGHPFQESIYIKNFCESIGEFFNVDPLKFKKNIRRYFLSGGNVSYFKFHRSSNTDFYKEQVTIKNMHSPGFWRYPLMDENELPVQFNNTKEEAFNNCKCYVHSGPAPHLKDGKIYKCPVTALLLQVVKVKNLYSDKWKHLSDYTPYNILEDHNQQLWDNLSIPEDVCAKCPVGKHQWDRNKTDLHSKIVFGPSVIN